MEVEVETKTTGSGHSAGTSVPKQARPAVATKPPLKSSAERKEKLAMAPAASITSTNTAAPPEQIHFNREEESVILSRAEELEKKGVKEGVHITFFDMGGQPEFASIAAEQLRRCGNSVTLL
jgi:hypothetical protein